MTPKVYEPSGGTRIVSHIVYGLHALSILIGVLTGATVASAFVFSWPSILAVILNYIFRGDAEGTYLESHFSWQIRTFWMAALLLVVMLFVGTLLMFVGIGIFVFLGSRHLGGLSHRLGMDQIKST